MRWRRAQEMPPVKACCPQASTRRAPCLSMERVVHHSNRLRKKQRKRCQILKRRRRRESLGYQRAYDRTVSNQCQFELCICHIMSEHPRRRGLHRGQQRTKLNPLKAHNVLEVASAKSKNPYRQHVSEIDFSSIVMQEPE